MTRRALVVAASEDTRAELVDVLEHLDHRVASAEGYASGLQRLIAERWSLVVADECLLGRSGTELLAQAALLQPAALRVLALGREDHARLVRAVNHAGVHYIAMVPIDRDDLASGLRALATDRLPALRRWPRRLRDVEGPVATSLHADDGRHPLGAGESGPAP